MKITKTKPSPAQTMSLLSKGTKCTGNLEASSALRIDGELEGDVISTDKIVTGIDSIVTGTIEADEVIIGGTVYGSVNAKKILTLQATGKVEGDIRALEILIEKGGFFKGACEMAEMLPTIQLNTKQA
ncbi:MAG: polymer-forming cytoskeletal protein [Roseivirga sp.]|nr:polymer-forming cytoskeletal protein [Roseivirga sp.]